MLGIEHEETGGALVHCGLTPPMPVREARKVLEGGDDADSPVSITAEELAARVVAAAGRAVEMDIALGHDAGPALPLIARALTGDPGGVPWPDVLPPWEDEDAELIVDAAEDEEGFHRVMDELLEEFEEHAKATYRPEGAVWEHGDFVASSMLQWKGGYGDGNLGRWTEMDVAEFLLDYFPRKVSMDEPALDAVPECVRAFLGFLDARGSLSGEPLEELERASEEMEDDFHERARDSSHWGLAKSLVMKMGGEGLDPSAPGALEAWMTDFNARPRAERDAVIGPAADRMAQAAGVHPAGGSQAAEKRAKRRKAQRGARKRNRRR
jgi:hypothetical protein